MGRPRYRADTTLNRVTLRIADDEIEMVRDAATAAGLTVSSYLRLVAIGTAVVPEQQRQRVLDAGAALNT